MQGGVIKLHRPAFVQEKTNFHNPANSLVRLVETVR